MSVKNKLVNLLCDFPNISTPRKRETFIDSVGLTQLADRIDFKGNTRTFFNSLINVIVRSGDRDGLLNFLDDLISSDWVGIDRIRELENFKAELQNLNSEQFKSEFIGSDRHSSLTRQEFKNRRDLLNLVKNEVEGRLRQSLHYRMEASIDLEKQTQPEPARRLSDANLKIGERPQIALSPETEIIEAFDHEDVAGKLWILGAPGSGKTTAMLELAAQLTRRAQDDPSEPMPALFDLSSFQEDKQPISEWLVRELNLKYGVRKDIAQNWVEGRQLLPILDGLDELESWGQELCVGGINDLLQGEYRPDFLVVCSRLEEYELHKKLNGAVCLQPLTDKQIEGYLKECQRPGLWSTIRDDSALLELVRTPLLLTMTAIAKISISEWGKLRSREERLSYLLDAYIVRMLTEDLKSRAYVRAKAPSPRQTYFWLIWVAQQMERESQSEFSIEKMQPYWLGSWKLQWLSRLIYGSIAGSILGLIYGSIVGPIAGAILGSIAGLILGLISREIKSAETRLFSMDGSSSQFKNNAIVGLIYGLIGGLIGGLMGGLTGGLIGGPIGGSIAGLFENLVRLETKVTPNQGIWNSLSNTRYVLMITFPIVGVLIILLRLVEPGMLKAICSGLALIVPFYAIFAFATPPIQHFSLRLVLYFTGKIPWNYARFLDYASDRTILQRVGGRYRFLHRLLQEHFASLGE